MKAIPMFCKHCGKQLLDTAAICVGCGSKTDNFETPHHGGNGSVNGGGLEHSTGKIVLFCFLIGLFPIAGYIMSIIFFTRKQNSLGGIYIGASIFWTLVWIGVNS